MGKEFMGIYGHTFVISPLGIARAYRDGRIEKIYRQVKAATQQKVGRNLSPLMVNC